MGNNVSISSRPRQFFISAPQPDIVRSSQKDQFYLKQFSDQTFDLMNKLKGPRFALKYQRDILFLTELAYYGLTTVLGQQTLGEEYCDIIQIHKKSLPNIFQRIKLISLAILFPFLLDKFQHTFLLHLKNIFPLTKLNITVPGISEIINRIHLALFYLYGKYYDISKRICGITYVFNRKPDSRRPQYYILGVLILIQLSVTFILFIREFILKKNVNEPLIHEELNLTEEEEVDSSLQESNMATKCALCLEPRKHTTSTPCGHLYCWKCIFEWCNNKAECPICRHKVELSSLICVYNY